MNAAFMEKLQCNSDYVPQHLRIKADPNPIFIFGAGAHAADVLGYCKNYNIEIEGFLINVPSDLSVFQGLPVRQMVEVEERHPRFSVILGYANYAGGLAALRDIPNIENIYCLASCCYGIWDRLPPDYLRERSDEYMDIYGFLEDDLSRECLISYLNCRVNDSAAFMLPYYQAVTNFYSNDVLSFHDHETLLDVGACEGNTIAEFVEAVHGKYGDIIALEPEAENYKKLRETVEKNGWERVHTQAVCAFNRSGTVKFSGTDELGGIVDTAESFVEYPAARIDDLTAEMPLTAPVSLMKLNFAFSVIEVLDGMAELIGKNKPKLIIRLGLDEKVMVDAIMKLKEMQPEYKFFLRYTIGIPQGLTLFAV